jgi:hypothetical protein
VLLAPERHGFKGALTKPFDPGKLKEILARITGGSPAKKIFHE